MRAQFVLTEIGIGLRRNLTMTIAVIVTVGGLARPARRRAAHPRAGRRDEGLLVRQGRGLGLPLRRSTRSGRAASDGVVSDSQRDQIEADLNALAEVEEVFYESKEEAFTHFQEQFKDSAIVDNVTPDQLPESFRVKLSNPEQFEIVASAFEGRPGVEERRDQKALLKRSSRCSATVQTPPS